MRKGFAAIIIVGLFTAIFVLGGAFYLKQNQKIPSSQSETQASPTPQSDETVYPDQIGANWKTYTGIDFQIKYPPSWEAIPAYSEDVSFWPSSSGLSAELNLSISDRSEEKQYYLGNDPVKTLNDYAMERKKGDKNIIIKNININNMEVLEIIYGDGKKLEQVAVEPDVFRGPKDYVFLKEGKFYIFGYYTEDLEAMKIFDQILSTFKFVE